MPNRPVVRALAPAFLFALLFPLSVPAAEPRQGELLEKRFRELDRNNDGILTRAEAGDAPWFDRLDRRARGEVSLEELRQLARRFGRDEAGGSAANNNSNLPPPDPATPAPPLPDTSPRQGPRLLKPADHGVGRLVADLAFTDVDGRAGRLSDHRSARALVIAFTGPSCPIAAKFAPALARIEAEFASQGVAFLFVNPTASDAPDAMRTAIRTHRLAGRYIHDREGRFAAALGAHTSTEIFVLDAARTLVFRGAISDQYGLGYALDAPRHEYLRPALTAVLAGRAPVIAATDAPGCALDVPAAAPTAAAPDLTYHGRIERIVQASCVECHRAGGLGPFSLETYADVVGHAGMIRKQVARGAMPPWFATPAAPGEPSHWRNDRSLAPADKADLLAWLASDRPRGDLATAPLPRTFPAGWSIGTPDAVIELPRAVAVKAEGTMPYQTLRVQTRFAEDKWVRAYEVQPTAPGVVHHVIIRVLAPGEKARAADDDESAGFFAAYVPGNAHRTFDPGFAKKLPAGATVIFQLHYTPNGTATEDRTRLGLVFADAPPRHIVNVVGLANPRLAIPPGAAAHAETATQTLPAAATILGFTPHMHLRGKAARYEAVLPDGTRHRLLDIPAYDFNWQLTYQLAEPLTLPRGTRLVYTAWYDNSAANPANPDPNKLVRWGQQTFDEMMLGYVEYYLPRENRDATARSGG